MTRLTYLDHAASTPLRPCASAAMADARIQAQGFGLNPSALHGAGRIAREMLEQARGRIAACLGADSAEVIFTSGGTEADAIVVRGGGEKVLISAFEHPAVTKNARRKGEPAPQIPVDQRGIVTAQALREALAEHPETTLVSVMSINNELGTIQDIGQLAALTKQVAPRAMFHTDAIQAAGRVKINFRALGLDALSICSHKIGGPHSIGALVLKREAQIVSDRPGGGQERKLRSGTQDPISALGFAAALEEACAQLDTENARLSSLKQRFLERLAQLNLAASPSVSPTDSCPEIIHLQLPGAPAEAMLLLLDQAGICASAGSACHAGVTRPSRSALAIGMDEARASQVLRLSLGYTTTWEDLEHLLTVLPEALARAQAFGGR